MDTKNPIDVFEKIIQETVTSDLYSHMKVMQNKCLRFLETQEEISRAQSEFSKIDPSNYSKELLISLLRIRHETWRNLVFANDVEQDTTLADNFLFMQEMNKFHGGDSSSDECSIEESSGFSYSNVFQLPADAPATPDNLIANDQAYCFTRS